VCSSDLQSRRRATRPGRSPETAEMSLSSKLLAGGIAAGAALAYYVQRRKARTGEGYLAIVAQLPGDARRWANDARRRSSLALEDGKSAARERDAELARQLAAVEVAPAAAGR
jgi:hypothetical protein